MAIFLLILTIKYSLINKSSTDWDPGGLWLMYLYIKLHKIEEGMAHQ